ncbi:hypothetical protein V8F20_004336 [Naviculisporaceae sp. PSN 640]
MADAKGLRIITIATFFPAFGLGVAHGTLSNGPVPAVGLVPLFFSSGFAIFLLSRHRKRAKDKQKQSDIEGTDAEASTSHEAAQQDDELTSLLARPHTHSSATPVAHPILVFFTDTALAAALMTVLVFTWIETSSSPSAELAMLAAYMTIPLLVNFFIHLHLAVREFAIGLALHDLFRWAAWQSVPPDCPHCGSRLRPDSLPAIPWYESVSAPEISFPKLNRPSIPKVSLPNMQWAAVKMPEWKTPSWLKKSRQGDDEHEDPEYARLFVDERRISGESDRDHTGYSDAAEVSVGPSAASLISPDHDETAVEEVVISRKKSKNTPPIVGDEGSHWS